MIRVAIDVDDTISEAPEFFKELTKSLLVAGNEVYILTAMDERWRGTREKELEDWGIVYTKMIFTLDKEKFCRDNEIDYAFDDERDYYPNSKEVLFNFLKLKYEK